MTNIRLILLVSALQGGAVAFEVEVGGYQVPEDTRVEKVNAFVDKAVEDQNYTEAEGCDSENGGQYYHRTQGLMKPPGADGEPDEHDCGIQWQPASFECPSNLIPQCTFCKFLALQIVIVTTAEHKGKSWIIYVSLHT